MKRIFQYRDYRKFLSDQAKQYGRGFASRLAAGLRCQSSFISQVMGGSVSFSAEHAIAVARILNLEARESEFLMLLVMRDRSGSKELSAYYDRKIDKMSALDREVKAHLQPSAQLSEEMKAVYYSSWKYQAVHVGASVPALASVAALSSYLGIPSDEVRNIADRLIEWGLISEAQGQLRNLQVSVHLSGESYLTPNFHMQWRLKSMTNMDLNDLRRLHFSSTVSLSRADASRIREILLESLRSQDDLIAQSPEEEVWQLNLDWFPVGKN
jgi:uncharacterized protein (TIGR02147 family)